MERKGEKLLTQENTTIKAIVEENQGRSQIKKWKWSEMASLLQERVPGCHRTGKQCRER
jgi:hypothetical protein